MKPSTELSSHEVAELFALSEHRIRYWAATGFVGPSGKRNGRGVYTFIDLIGIKAAKELLDGGMPLQRARRCLAVLRAQLPELRQPLSRLRLIDGEPVVIVDGSAPFNPTTGQLLLDLSVDSLAQQIAELHPDGDAAYRWFQEGLEHQSAGDADSARRAFERALVIEPHLAAAYTNLGNLAHAAGDTDGARKRYLRALELDPDQPEARYNFANLLDEAGEHALAVNEWYRVTTDWPEFADAHFNLALAFVEADDRGRARTHLERYISLTDDGKRDGRAQRLLGTL